MRAYIQVTLFIFFEKDIESTQIFKFNHFSFFKKGVTQYIKNKPPFAMLWLQILQFSLLKKGVTQHIKNKQLLNFRFQFSIET